MILFDLSVCQPIGNSKFHGGGVYGYMVFRELCNQYPDQISVYYDPSRYLPDDVAVLIKGNDLETFDASIVSIVDAYSQGHFSKIYSPLYSQSYEKLFERNIPLLVTIHGLRALEMNRDRYEWRYAGSMIERVKIAIKHTPLYRFIFKRYKKQYETLFDYKNAEIITVSEHSKASIAFHYPQFPVNRVKVRYSPNTSIDTPKQGGENCEKYYLIISANRWLKNAYRALLAFDNLYKQRGDRCDFKIYVVGINEKHAIARNLAHRDKFKFFQYLEREELEDLFANAYTLVYPTLNEGFGYPPVEAMRYGVPVITSGIASIPEVCGEAALYFNPYSIQEIANRIIQIENPSLRDEYQKRSLARYSMILDKQKRDLKLLIEDIIS